MNSPRRILIIKTGFSEFLDRGISTTVSLGDVLLCTALLRRFRRDRVTWVTSRPAEPLLKGHPAITELIVFGPEIFSRLARRRFDVVINLEKEMGLCAFAVRIPAGRRHGFYFDGARHDVATTKRTARYLLIGQEHHTTIDKNALEILFESVGLRWRGEGVWPAVSEAGRLRWDIGLNHEVGRKWPTKGWPPGHWRTLESLLKGRFRVSWQRGFRNLETYIRWVAGCRLLVTSDSLGQAVAQGLGRRVLSLFGPTNPRRMEGIPGIEVVRSPSACPHMPCYLPVCRHTSHCMEELSPRTVADLCERILR